MFFLEVTPNNQLVTIYCLIWNILFNYNYSDVANLKGTIDGKLMGVSQEGVTHSYGLFNYNYKSDVIKSPMNSR